MPESPPITDALTTLQSWMREHAPGVSFCPPADLAAIEHFADKSGLTLPDELVQILMVADGEPRKSAGSIGNWRFMPIGEIQAAWGLLRQLAAKGAFTELEAQPSPYLQQTWWHPAWIPFISNDTGNYFCIDSNPPEPERYGQVLLFLHNQPERPLVAGSLGAWLDRINRDLAAGVYTFDKVEGFNAEAFLWSALEGKHLFNDIDGTLVVQDQD
jgi:cell wall assembly regulator SMI1